ncbi:hypothetical protein F4802DRAFT_279464 [Xylaria palmicola]|nr:hypothetical protein F4802DRAFT_279464 [Xylaria palmicola]
MPSAQPHLPTETSKGTGTSTFDFSIPLVPALRRGIARLRSAIPFGGSGDMTKPGNVGAPKPINTLNNTSSRAPHRLPPAGRSISSSPPQAKRRKLDDASANSKHSHAVFVVTDSPTGKRSIENVSITDSQHSGASSMSSLEPNVTEFRKLDHYTKAKRHRTNRKKSIVSEPEGVEQPGSSIVSHQRNDEELTDDEVDLIKFHETPAGSGSNHPKDEEPKTKPILYYLHRFKTANTPTGSTPATIFSNIIDNADEKVKSRRRSFSPDELVPSPEELAARRPAKRQKNSSVSLSSRGHINPTKFKGTSTTKSTSTEIKRMDENLVKSKDIVGPGLRILRGMSGQCQYQAGCEDDPIYCCLTVREIGHRLFPVDKDNNLLKAYSYLTLDISRVEKIFRADKDEGCLIVSIKFASLDLSNSAGPKLMIEFSSASDFTKFFAWVSVYRRGDRQVEIQNCNSDKLEKDLDEMIQRAKSHRIITDEDTGPPIADDIKVIQHNRERRLSDLRMNPSVTTESKTQPKMRDAMRLSAPGPSGTGLASRQLRDDQPASTQRQARRTRATFAILKSPEPSEPEPEGWTSLNIGWEKQWRNSLVYPMSGKNRATIDKDDIQRLDEGQFLNDNIIIFYLRYLQKNLEDKNKALAKRVYFQNTFFYDKLKPVKSGQGINYDSVKTWTSKVDLFSKDYIIVPINEYNHWYVAIICNAPKLLCSEPPKEAQYNQKGDAVTSNGVDISGEAEVPASSQNGVSDDSTSAQHLVSPAQGDVTEKFRQNKAGEGTCSIPTENGQEVYVVSDLAKPELEVEHIRTAPSPHARKKSGKKQSPGLRKYDPNQPRIITLDSLGAPHSPTCSYLRFYLVAELRDKKGIEIPLPGAMGITAKGIPEQTNHCDCGLFLLGYIRQFLLDPDGFVKSVLQRDGQIPWRLDPSELRNDIRDLIFRLQKEQQGVEDSTREQKRRSKLSRSGTKPKEDRTPRTAPTTKLSPHPISWELASQDLPVENPSESKSPPDSPSSRPSSSRDSNTVVGDQTALQHSPVLGADAEDDIIEAQSPALRFQEDNSKMTQQTETGVGSSIEKTPATPKLDLHMALSPSPNSDHGSNPRVPDRFSFSPIRGRVAAGHVLSPEAMNVEAKFLPPLSSETSSSKESRGATPLDPVVVDDSGNDGPGKVSRSPPRPSGGHSGSRFIVELPSTNSNSRSPGRESESYGRKQTEHRSSYFASRVDGEKMMGAKLRETPHQIHPFIDLSID